MSLLSDCKDRVLEKMALPLLNGSILKPYGKATRLRINSSAKTVDLELELAGETELLEIQIKQYELLKEGVSSFLLIREIEISRPWLSALAQEHLLNRRLPLPPQAAGALSHLL